MKPCLSKLVVCALSLIIVAGCGNGVAVSINLPLVADEKLYDGIVALAQEKDKTVEDGWFFGQEPRVFKSGYGRISPQEKANFALAYRRFVHESGQNMRYKWESYIPYSKRSVFAREWFSDRQNDSEFSNQDPKYKVAWIHEALLDGGELWWRVYENIVGDKLGGPAIMAHDAEQSLVSKYAESESKLGSFSTQPR